MNRIARIAAVIALFAIAAVNLAGPVLAAEGGDDFYAAGFAVANQDGHGDDGHGEAPGGETVGDVVPRVTWMLVGVAASAVVLSVLYLLKKRVGGFPKNPTWVAPITIMPSSQLPGDRDPHEADSEDGHHPAHAAGH